MSAGVKIPGLSRRLRGEVYDHVYDNHTHEVGGVLVGDLGDGEMPVVTGAIAALEARGERASVTFTHDAWSSIHAQMESAYPGKQIVGWYHSHPGFGIFLSGHDMFIQENFFSDPRQIAYVVDPHAGTEGVFGWRGGKVELLEEAPAGRLGTGGGRPPENSSSSGGVVRYGGLVAVVLVFLGIGGALIASGADEANRDEVPLAASPLAGGVVGAIALTYPSYVAAWTPQPQPQPAPQTAPAAPTTPTPTVTVQSGQAGPAPAPPPPPPPPGTHGG